MADVFAAYIRGQQAGQANIAHKQALEDSKLRQQVLKHQIEGLKIADQQREREIAMQNLQLLHGQPAADIPSDESSTLPTQKSYAGAMTGLPGAVSDMVRSNMGGEQASDLNFSHLGQGQPEAPAAPAQPPLQTMAAPEAQDMAAVTTRTPRPVMIPGVGNQPGVSVRPQSMEDLVRMAVMAKLNEPFNLGPGQKRFIGGREVASGGKPTPTRASLELAAAGGDETVAATNMRPQGSTSTDPDRAARLQYADFRRDFTRRYPSMTVTEREGAKTRALLDPNAAAPSEPPAVPSFEKWREMTPGERQNVLAKPEDRIDDATMLERAAQRDTAKPAAKPQRTPGVKQAASGEVPPDVINMLQGVRPGNRVKLSDGSVWDVMNDGSIRQVSQP